MGKTAKMRDTTTIRGAYRSARIGTHGFSPLCGIVTRIAKSCLFPQTTRRSVELLTFGTVVPRVGRSADASADCGAAFLWIMGFAS